MMIPIVTTIESLEALQAQGFVGEPITTVNKFCRIHENFKSVVIGACGERYEFDSDCYVEDTMFREATRFAHLCKDSGNYSSVVISVIDTQSQVN